MKLRILLVCNAGMSTSMLVSRMQAAAKEKNIELDVEAKPIIAAEREMIHWDVIMLGPQVRHHLAGLRKLVDGKVPIEIIDMKSYGMMNAMTVLEQGIKVIEQYKANRRDN